MSRALRVRRFRRKVYIAGWRWSEGFAVEGAGVRIVVALRATAEAIRAAYERGAPGAEIGALITSETAGVSNVDATRELHDRGGFDVLVPLVAWR